MIVRRSVAVLIATTYVQVRSPPLDVMVVDVVAHASRRPAAGAPKRQSSISPMARSVWRSRPSASHVRITMSRFVRSMRSPMPTGPADNADSSASSSA